MTVLIDIIGGGGACRAMAPHFCWNIFEKIKMQSVTQIEESTILSLKPVGSYFSNIVKNTLSELLNCEFFLGA